MRELDEDERREAIDERRAGYSGCKCGNPDWPGSCPGWQNCPAHGDDRVACNSCGELAPDASDDGEGLCEDCLQNRAERAYERQCEDFHDGGSTAFRSLRDQQIEALKLK